MSSANFELLSCLSVADLQWGKKARGASWWLECLFFWWFKNTGKYFVILHTQLISNWVCISDHILITHQSFSPAAGHSTGRTLRRWGSCGSACSAFILKTSTSESMLCVSVSTAAWPPSTSSGHPNTLSLKVSLCDKLRGHTWPIKLWMANIKHRSI